LQRYCHLLYPGGNGFAVIVVLVVVIDPAVVAPRRALRRGSLAAGLLQVQGHRRCLVGLSFVLSPARDTAGALGISDAACSTAKRLRPRGHERLQK